MIFEKKLFLKLDELEMLKFKKQFIRTSKVLKISSWWRRGSILCRYSWYSWYSKYLSFLNFKVLEYNPHMNNLQNYDRKKI